MSGDLLRVFLAAMTPLGELRLSIPLGVWGLGLSWPQVLAVSLVGNMVPVVPLVFGLDRLATLLTRVPNPLGRLLTWRTERLRATQSARFQRYGALALAIFVGVPLPLTGAWTGALAAWVFKIPARLALPSIGAGVLLAGAIVTSIVVAGLRIGILLAA
ncbi:MAG: small multi-drug export protein [Chloroflexi bacterium]|nr:small multi-drug export protein [Chloroflexota bacterium]